MDRVPVITGVKKYFPVFKMCGSPSCPGKCLRSRVQMPKSYFFRLYYRFKILTLLVFSHRHKPQWARLTFSRCCTKWSTSNNFSNLIVSVWFLLAYTFETSANLRKRFSRGQADNNEVPYFLRSAITARTKSNNDHLIITAHRTSTLINLNQLHKHKLIDSCY